MIWIKFERGRDEVSGPVFGPYEYAEQTYEMLRTDLDECLAVWSSDAGEWFIEDGKGHDAEFYSDFVISSDPWPDGIDHNCDAGRLTFDGDGEQRWDSDLKQWVPTGRVWDSVHGRMGDALE